MPQSRRGFGGLPGTRARNQWPEGRDVCPLGLVNIPLSNVSGPIQSRRDAVFGADVRRKSYSVGCTLSDPQESSNATADSGGRCNSGR